MSSDLAPEAETLATAVLAVPGVAELHGGVLGEVATYLPGRRVAGIRLDVDGAEVHIVIDWDAPALTTAEAVRGVVEALVSGPVHVVVEDVATPNPHPKDT
ncbi:MAG: hypothetical protein JWO46_2871 [Nocardioidaceae bacterium]|nr:hypothetical protein [Nocardioidaceae bacterium]